MPSRKTAFPHAAFSYNVPVGTGRVFFVDSGATGASDGNLGDSPERPLATIEGAFNHSDITASNGDMILTMPGHSETMSTAAGIDADVAGVHVLGLGEGRNRPTILFTATAADIDIDADNITFENFFFDVTGIDAVVAAIDVNAADFRLRGCEVVMADSGGQCTEFILTDANADRMKIIGNVIKAPNAGANNAISIVGTPDAIEILDNDIYGDFGDACIHNPTGNVATNIRIEGNTLQNDNAGEHAIELVSAVTGWIKNNDMITDDILTVVDPGSCQQKGNHYYDSTNVDRAAFPYPPDADYNPLLGYRVQAADANSPQGVVTNIFTINGGRVLITRLVGQVGTVVQAAASVWKLTHNPTVGSSVDIAADLDMTGMNAGSLIEVQCDGTALIAVDGQETILTVAANNGVPLCEVDVGVIEWESGESTSGTAKWDLWYWPIESGAIVTGS